MLRSVACVALVLLAGCQRERRDTRAPAARNETAMASVRDSDLMPGGSSPQPPAPANPYNGNAYAISEGQRLYNQFNCSGCHFNGGGGIGPSFLDKSWAYGGEPGQIYESIVKGRPNGMPSWSGKIPENQVWQIVAYVRSLSGDQPKNATPARTDIIQQDGTTIVNRVPGKTR